MTAQRTNWVVSVSKLISNFFNPMVSLLIFYIYHSTKNLNLKGALDYIAPILLIVIFPIIVWIVMNVRKGNYTNMDVSNRKQRKSLYYFIIAALLVYLGYFYVRFSEVDYMMFYLLILLILMHFSNFFIKSSMHTSLNVFVATLFYSENQVLGIAWLVLSAIIGLTRVILKRHTPAEVFSGAFIAVLVSIPYLYSTNQSLF